MVREMHALRSTADVLDQDEVIPEAPMPVEHLFEATDAAPAAPRRDIRYERGSTVYALDGPVGTLKQIVIDEDLA
jgi:hypothetical protein